MKLLHELRKLQNTHIRKLVEQKIQEFGSIKQNQLFNELCFCLLTANYNAKGALKLQKNIGDKFSTLSLKQLQEQGMRTGLIAVFLYNRAIKIPLLPLMVYYFGLKFVIVLLFYMIIASLVEGKIIEMKPKRKVAFL